MNDLLELYDDIIHYTSSHGPSFPEERLTGFGGLIGASWEGDLLVVGRSVNDWRTSWVKHDGVLPDRRQELAAKVVQERRDGGEGCPMEWVLERWGNPQGGYNTRTSAFWRVTKQTCISLLGNNAAKDTWSSLLAWTNLYKVAPKGGGTPSKGLRRAQLPLCKKIFKRELTELEPARVLFLTGVSWVKPFLSDLSHEVVGASESEVEWGLLRQPKTIQYVVVPHPEGKKEKRLTDAVVGAFNQMDGAHVG